MANAREHNSKLIEELIEEAKLNQDAKLDRCSFTFTQEGNGNGTTEEYEELIIECEASLGIDNDDGCFYVLKTTTGWSMDSVDELQKLFDRIQKAINK